MKNSKPMKLTLVMCLATAAIRGAAGAVCTSTSALAAAAGGVAPTAVTCDCPAGTGTIGAVASSGSPSALGGTSGTGLIAYYSTNAGSGASKTTTLTVTGGTAAAAYTAANIIALCVDVFPGFYVPAAYTAPVPCTGTGTYCLGKTGVYTSGGGGGTLAYSGTSITYPVQVDGSTLAKGRFAVCPPGWSSPTATVASVDETVCVDMAPGYYQKIAIPASTANDLTVATATYIGACTAGYYCPGKSGLLTGLIDVGSSYDGAGSAAATTFNTLGNVAAVAAPASNTAPNQITCGTGTNSAAGATATSTSACSILLPGYYIPSGAAAGASPSLCSAGNYCSGSTSTSPALASTITVAATANFGLTACPPGTTSGAVVASGAVFVQTNIASYPSTNVLGQCSLVAPGYYLPTAAGATSAAATCTLTATTQSGAGGYCSIPTPCSTANYCPGSTTAMLSLNGATITDLGTSLLQGFKSTAGSQAANKVLAASAASSPTFLTGCTTGFGISSSTSAVSAATGCSAIAPGYYLVAGSTTPASCVAVAGTYCPGFSSGAYSGVTVSTNAVTNTATTASGVVSCPAGITGAANQASIAAACTDLAAGYALVPAVTTTKIATLIQACPTGATCAGSAGFFGGSFSNFGTTTGASATDDNWANAGIKSCGGTAAAQGSSGNTAVACGAALDLLNSTDITSSVTTLVAGTVVATVTINGVALTAGVTNAAALFGFVSAGYYIAPYSFTPYPCPTGSFCSGGEGLGDFADVDAPPLPCPAGSRLGPDKAVTLTTSGTNYAANNAGSAQCTPGTDCVGCVLLPGFYSSAGQVGLCPANSYCPGGVYLGSPAPSSFQCTANSTIEACNTYQDNIQSNSYAAGASTTNVAAAAPAVTVSPAAVTVTPAPITVTPAPITVTTAPITVTPASQPISINVPAPVSAAFTRSSALVLVLAALAALAAF